MPPAAPTPPPVAPAPAPAPAPAGSSNNTLAAVGYLVWICALIAVLIEKEDKQVKFQAWNALFWGIAGAIVLFVVNILAAILAHMHLGIIALVLNLVYPLWVVMSIIYLVNGLNRKPVNIPVVSDLARKQAGL